ncbi:hypothetical protein D1007_02717 [Hordeum vulgare]|nr:hypothetical protein D1007_02717 [Hordeum vulgare]
MSCSPSPPRVSSSCSATATTSACSTRSRVTSQSNHVRLLNPLTSHLTELPPLTTLLPSKDHAMLSQFRIDALASCSGIASDNSTVVLCFNSPNQPPRLEVAAKLNMRVSPISQSMHLVNNGGELMLVHRQIVPLTSRNKSEVVGMEQLPTVVHLATAHQNVAHLALDHLVPVHAAPTPLAPDHSELADAAH